MCVKIRDKNSLKIKTINAIFGTKFMWLINCLSFLMAIRGDIFFSQFWIDVYHLQQLSKSGYNCPLSPNRLSSTGCPKKHGNSVTNSISSLLWISIVIPKFKSHNIIMSARVYFMKRVKDCKDEFIISPQDEQWRRTSLLCLYTSIFLFSLY